MTKAQLVAVLEANDGLCMDNAAERDRLADVLMKHVEVDQATLLDMVATWTETMLNAGYKPEVVAGLMRRAEWVLP